MLKHSTAAYYNLSCAWGVEITDHQMQNLFSPGKMGGKQQGVQSVSGCSQESHYFWLKYAMQVNLNPQGCHWCY